LLCAAKQILFAIIVDTPTITRTLVLISMYSSLLISGAFWIANGIQETSLSLLGMAGISALNRQYLVLSIEMMTLRNDLRSQGRLSLMERIFSPPVQFEVRRLS